MFNKSVFCASFCCDDGACEVTAELGTESTAAEDVSAGAEETADACWLLTAEGVGVPFGLEQPAKEPNVSAKTIHGINILFDCNFIVNLLNRFFFVKAKRIS